MVALLQRIKRKLLTRPRPQIITDDEIIDLVDDPAIQAALRVHARMHGIQASGHQFIFDEQWASYMLKANIDASGLMPVSTSGIHRIVIVASTAEVNTLSDPNGPGLFLVLCAVTVGTGGTRAITYAASYNASAMTVLTFTATRQVAVLFSVPDKTGGTTSGYRWHLVYADPTLNVPVNSAQDAMTAFATGGQTNATQITADISRFTTVATAGDSAKLPPAAPGQSMVIINSGAKPMQVFGTSTDTINDVASGTGITQMPNSIITYDSTVAGKWYTEGAGTGFSGSLQTLSVTDNLTAFAGGGQASALALTTGINRVATVATAADSVKLPLSAPGMQITVINDALLPIQVFGTSPDTINDAATATGVSQAGNSVAIYTCSVAGTWNSTSGFGNSFAGLSYENGITAFSGGGQGSARLLVASISRVATVAATGDSVKLPVSIPGMQVTVVNGGANNTDVFPSTGDQINAIGANLAFRLAVNNAVTFYCAVAGSWSTQLPPLKPNQFTTSSVTGATLAAGVITGGIYTEWIDTNAAPGVVTTRTATQMFNDIPNATILQGYILRVGNRNVAGAAMTFTAGGGVTFTDSAAANQASIIIPCNTYMDFNVRFGSATAVVFQQIGNGPLVAPVVLLSANGAIPPNLAATYVITKAGVLADTLAAPTAGTDDGNIIVVTSSTANAHTVTATGLFQTGTASVNLATFAANVGAGFTIMAYNGKWQVLSSVGITFS